jgi:hypothetical protein
MRFIKTLILCVVLLLSILDAIGFTATCKIYLSGNDCLKCNGIIKTAIVRINYYGIPKETYTDIPPNPIYNELFTEIGLDRKSFKKSGQIDRSYILITPLLKSESSLKFYLYDFDETLFEKALKAYSTSVLGTDLNNWNLTQPMLPKKAIALFNNFAFTLNYTNNGLTCYQFDSSRFERIQNDAQWIKKTIEASIQSSTESINFIKLQQIDSFVIESYFWVATNDSAQTNHYKAIWKFDTNSPTGLRLHSCVPVPHQIETFGNLELFINYRAGIIDADSFQIVNVYTATGDINQHNRLELDKQQFKYPVFAKKSKMNNGLTYFPNTLPKESFISHTYYFNLGYSLFETSDGLYATEKMQPYIFLIGDTSTKYCLSNNAKQTPNPYSIGASTKYKTVYAATLNDMIVICSYENKKYYLILFSTSINKVIYKQPLPVRNPVFGIIRNNLVALDIGGSKLKHLCQKKFMVTVKE